MVDRKFLMCGKHWAMVPARIKRRVLDLYRPGQEDDGNFTRDYLRAAADAIAAVAALEGNPQEDDILPEPE